MLYVYVIQSLSDLNYFYKGHCENLEKRLKQHNAGMTKSNKSRTPFRIVYYEEFDNLESVLKRENTLKLLPEGDF